jgi:hypothetical protein
MIEGGRAPETKREEQSWQLSHPPSIIGIYKFTPNLLSKP